ncbi:unnamed protein product [Eretmochelys imbricata]
MCPSLLRLSLYSPLSRPAAFSELCLLVARDSSSVKDPNAELLDLEVASPLSTLVQKLKGFNA